jgi:hypothetical protein
LRWLRIAFCFTAVPAGLAFMGGAGAVDAGGNVTVGLVGNFVGVVFSGFEPKRFAVVFGPMEEGEDQ